VIWRIAICPRLAGRLASGRLPVHRAVRPDVQLSAVQQLQVHLRRPYLVPLSQHLRGVRGSSPGVSRVSGVTGQMPTAVVGHHFAERAGDVERATALAAVELEVCAVQVSYDPFGI